MIDSIVSIKNLHKTVTYGTFSVWTKNHICPVTGDLIYSTSVPRKVEAQPVSKRRRVTSRSMRIKVLKRDGYMCRYCYERANTVDHIIPVAFNQIETMLNLVSCCSRCNSKLGSQVFVSLEEKAVWIQENLRKANRVVPLWVESEVMELGHTLRTKVFDEAFVARDESERRHIAHQLEKMNFVPRYIEVSKPTNET